MDEVSARKLEVRWIQLQAYLRRRRWFMPATVMSREVNGQTVPRPWYASFSIWTLLVVGLLFLACAYVAGFASAAVNPMIGPSRIMLLYFGVKYTPLMLAPTYQLYRLLSAMLVHPSLVQLVIATFFQLHVGTMTEFLFGIGPTFGFFSVSGICGYLWSTALGERELLVGGLAPAQAGLFGLLGAFMLNAWSATSFVVKRGQLAMLVAFFAVGYLPVAFRGADMQSLLGGWLAGLSLGMIYLNRKMNPVFTWRRALLSVLSAAFLLVSLAGLPVVLVRGASS